MARKAAPVDKALNPTTDSSFGYIPPTIDDTGLLFKDIGSSGLRQFGGWVREEFLQQLQGRQGARVYREMADNNASVGAITFAIQQTMRDVEWRVIPADQTPKALEMADWADSLRGDMSMTWEDFIVEALSMLTFGYAPHEIVYKRRLGRNPPSARDDEDPATSLYDDGTIGIRRLPLRGQDTVLKWFFGINGETLGLTQQPWVGPLIDIPIEKLLLFRPVQFKNNPEGRALDPETSVPTPDGWRYMDELEIGDKVFDEAGRIRYVVARADWPDRPCWELTFGDGTQIIADENHEWVTQTLHERTRQKTARRRSTAEIAETLKTKAGSSNHSIEWAAPLDYPKQELPIDPYFLGLWLGDGTSRTSSISCHEQDAEETVALITACGYEASLAPNGRPDGKGRLITVTGDGKWDRQGPASLLTSLGLRQNKHIPESYLRGSIEQRRALLAGLMDSDGHADDYGRCEFTNCNVGLVYGVAQLVRSLGCSASTSLRKLADGVDRKQDAWVARFRPNWSPFRLSRKASKVREGRSRDRHYITRATKVENRRTVCIEVDGPSHLFLAGIGMVPTSNSVLRNSYRPYYFLKRLEEMQAINLERMSGVPVITIPSSVASAAEGSGKDADAAKATIEEYKRIVTNVRQNEQMGLVMYSDTYRNGDGTVTAVPMYKFELVTPASRATADFEATKQGYKLDILTTVLADFIALGHGARGTQALATSKIDLFYSAVSGWLSSVASVLNRYLLPRLWALNGFDYETMPSYEPDLPQRVDLDGLSQFIFQCSQAGITFADVETEKYLRDVAGLPDAAEEGVDQTINASPDPAAEMKKILKASLAKRLRPLGVK